MSTIETIHQMENSTNHYLQELDQFTLEQLRQKPSESEWSLGQMYLHLINTALYMQLRNIELCRKGEAGSVVINGAKSEAGVAVFGQGSFPSVRIQVPASPQYTPAQPESKEQIVEGLNMVLVKMKEMEPTLEEISPQMTVAHPRLGELNAKEWFSLVEMHYGHHLHQMDRLKQYLETVNK